MTRFEIPTLTTDRLILRAFRAGDLDALSQEDAQKRVDKVIAKAKEAEVKARQAADAARKAETYLSLFTPFSMLIGAFIAAVAGKIGGDHRDSIA